MPKGNFVKDSPEVVAIKAAEQEWKDGKFWTTQCMIGALVFYALTIAFIWTDTMWLFLALIAVAFWIARTILDVRDRKRLAAFRKLVDAHYKKKSLPFYQDVLDKFGDEYHVHHNDNGSITLEKYKDVREAQKHNNKQEN